MARLFGTDGIRGVAGRDLTIEMAMNLGKAIPAVLGSVEFCEKRPVVVIGKDTRKSSDMLEAAITAGLCSAGADVISVGVVPTPAVPYIVRLKEACAGVMISASHNPFEYNGIKLFDMDGLKLPDEVEDEIEGYIKGKTPFGELACDSKVGTVTYDESLYKHYVKFLAETINTDFSGMRLAVDCANGSASRTARELFTRLGAECVFLHESPNGVNINCDCGSTHIDKLGEYVKENNFFAGLAFDGDADRFLAVDENGEVLDGDQIIAAVALDLMERRELNKNTAVITVMSNLGLMKFFDENNISYVTTQVGDRYVLEEMIDKGYDLGGEQSGHIIFGKYATTGDGQLTAIKFLAMCREKGCTFSDAGKVMVKYPQVQKGVSADAAQKKNYRENSALLERIRKVDEELGCDGRILVRPSGTEPLIRIMIEGKNLDEITALSEKIAADIVNSI